MFAFEAKHSYSLASSLPVSHAFPRKRCEVTRKNKKKNLERPKLEACWWKVEQKECLQRARCTDVHVKMMQLMQTFLCGAEFGLHLIGRTRVNLKKKNVKA